MNRRSFVHRHWKSSAAGAVALLLTASLGGITHASAASSPFEGSKLFSTSGNEITDNEVVASSPLLPLTVEVPRGTTAVEGVKFVLDGVYLGVDTTAPYQLPATTLVNGEHKLRYTIESKSADHKVSLKFTVSSSTSPDAPLPGPKPSPSPKPSPTLPTTTTTVPKPTTTTTLPAPSHPLPPMSGNEIRVSNAVELKTALAQVKPGMTITLADGSYRTKEARDGSRSPGKFVTTTAGTAQAPITLRGSRNAIIDGDGPGGSYGLHLSGADHWKLEGFSITQASKGLVLDRSNHVVIDGIRVTDIGQEGVHFRAFSSDNVIKNSEVANTGLTSEGWGEGVYLGSAHSNWPTHSNGKPDTSDRNQVLNNRIVDTRGENIDVKEGTTGGVIRGNYLGGDKTSGKNSADSWLNVKGNDYLIEGNHGVHTSIKLASNYANCNAKGLPNQDEAPFCYGFEVFVLVDGWGERNVFTKNVLEVNANVDNPTVGIWFHNRALDKGNVIRCDNLVKGATAGDFAYNHYTTMSCTP